MNILQPRPKKFLPPTSTAPTDLRAVAHQASGQSAHFGGELKSVQVSSDGAVVLLMHDGQIVQLDTPLSGDPEIDALIRAAREKIAGVMKTKQLVAKSIIRELHGLPCPVQFRNQGVLEEWWRMIGAVKENQQFVERWKTGELALENGLHRVKRFLEQAANPESPEAAKAWEDESPVIAEEIAANLLFDLREGALIEVAPALAAMLLNSDIEASLPMGLAAPPFSAQYICVSEDTARAVGFHVGDPDELVDGVFCFVSHYAENEGRKKPRLEFAFMIKRHGKRRGVVRMAGPVDSDAMTFSEWMTLFLAQSPGADWPQATQDSMRALAGYVAKVFLYMGLKDARQVVIRDYSEAQKRAAGIGRKKQAKRGRKIALLYDRIVVGPTSLPEAEPASGGGHAVAPHWRRGHFRMHAHGPGYAERKLIFLAPVLVHADQLAGDLPSPKAYRAGR